MFIIYSNLKIILINFLNKTIIFFIFFLLFKSIFKNLTLLSKKKSLILYIFYFYLSILFFLRFSKNLTNFRILRKKE